MSQFPSTIGELRTAFFENRVRFFGLVHARKDLPEKFAKAFADGRFLTAIRTKKSVIELEFDDGAQMPIETKINPKTGAPIDIVSFENDRITIEKALADPHNPKRLSGNFARYVYRVEIVPYKVAAEPESVSEAEPATAAPGV